MTRPLDRAHDLDDDDGSPMAGDPEAARLAEAIAGELTAPSARSPSALAELRQWRDRLDAILRVVTDGVVVLNFTGAVVYANAGAMALLGVDRTQLLGRAGESVFDGVTDTDGRRAAPAAIPGVSYFHGATLSTAILRLRTGEREAWIRARSAPLVDERGGVVAAIVVLRDVSDGRRAEMLARALHERDELLRVTQDVSPIGMIYFRILRDDGGRAVDLEYAFQNQAAAKLNGLGVGAACAGKRVREVFPALETSAIFARYREVADTGVAWRGEDHYRDEQRDNWYRLVVVRPTADTLSVSVEDVTAQRRLAERLQRLNELTAALSAARTVEEVADVAVRIAADAIDATTAVLARRASSDALVVVRAHGISDATLGRFAEIRFDARSPLAEAAASRRPLYVERSDEFARRFPGLRSIDDGAEAAVAALPLLMHGELVGAVGFRFADAHRFEDGERKFLEALASQVAMALDRAILFDEAKRAEAAASAANLEAQQASRAKDEFLAMLGHELRNPLAPIVTALHLMRMRGAHAVDRERNVIERQVEHLTRLVDDLLDISRITRGKVELRREPVRLVDVLARAVEATSPLFEKKQHRVDVAPTDEELHVLGDAVRLAQVFGNLLINAAKYTRAGGRVSVTMRREGASAIVRVRDDGMGIPAELLPRVFDLFIQGRQAIDRAEGGLGLGLAIVRSLVVAHGGAVEAHSDGVDCGSEFVVRLPALARVQVVAAASSPTSEPVARMRVLVVDDNRDAADLLGELLSEIGCDVRVALDGPSALDVVSRGFVPDVGLLDIGLPVMDGYELAARLRAATVGHAVRLIAVTGYGQPSDQRRSAESGFHAHLVKPVDPNVLQALLHEMKPS